jgi:hypothetical protein
VRAAYRDRRVFAGWAPEAFEDYLDAGFVDAPGGGVRLRYPREWEARIFDLWGRHVRDLGGDALGPGARDAAWDGRDDGGETVAPGGYVVVVRRFAADGGLLGSARCLAVVDAERGRP